MQPHRIVNPVMIRNWEALVSLAEQLPGWVFRRQRSSRWRLTSRLERTVAPGLLGELAGIEAQSLPAFRATNPSLVPDPVPDDNDVMSWFALMQHHGTPTRFLDFTESIAIATYFTLVHEEADQNGDEAAIWAVNTGILRKMVEQQIRLMDGDLPSLQTDWVGGGLFNFLYGRTRIDGVGAVAARAACTNPRMRRQKGLFVYPLNLSRSLENNLFGVYSLSSDAAYEHVHRGYWNGIEAPHIIPKLRTSPVIKIIIPSECHPEIAAAVSATGTTRALLFDESGSQAP